VCVCAYVHIQGGNNALTMACVKGYFPVARWLVETVGLDINFTTAVSAYVLPGLLD